MTLGTILFKIVFLLLLVVGGLYSLYTYLVDWIGVDDAAVQQLHFPPSSLDHVKQIFNVFEQRAARNPMSILMVYSTTYLIKQAFAVPGSALMNVLAGALYGHWRACLLVSFLTGIGASLCYLLSWFLGKELLEYFMKKRLHSLRKRVKDNRRELFFYLLSMRMFPLTPNWFINIASPHGGISLPLFFTTILIGLIPYNFMTTGAGSILNDVSSLNDIFQPSAMLKLLLLALVVLSMPLLRKRWMKPEASRPHRE